MNLLYRLSKKLFSDRMPFSTFFILFFLLLSFHRLFFPCCTAFCSAVFCKATSCTTTSCSTILEKKQRNTKPHIVLGIERLFSSPYKFLIEKKRIGLITNQTAISTSLKKTCDILIEHHDKALFRLQALFTPEHGLMGEHYAGENVACSTYKNIPVFSLHGNTRRPTKEMLNKIEVLVFDIQDIGSRSYTFLTTLLYCMEEAARWNIKVIVLDRPNPLGGLIIDGPMLEDSYKSFVGYINIPYCHGMTVAEIAQYFNSEYKIKADLTVIPMLGWKRSMKFQDTQLAWIPTSPNIPEAISAFFYPITGILGELGCVSIGIGYTLPFKVVAAPWIDACEFVKELNRGQIKGIRFQEIWLKPYSGQWNGKKCQGALLLLTDEMAHPVTTFYWICDVLKKMYPKQFTEVICSKQKNKQLEMFYKVCGTKKIAEILLREKKPFAALCALHAEERACFKEKCQQYLISSYSDK